MSAKRVLVLLAARNGAAFVARQIDSVLAQREVEVVIEVRDDGSTDATRDIIGTLAARDPRVRLQPNHVASGSASANFFRLVAAVDASAFDVVAFCDQDDEWYSGKLARAAEMLDRSGAEGYSAATLAHWPDGRERVLAQNTTQRDADYLFEGAGQGCTFVMTARLFALLRDVVLRHPAAVAAVHYHDWAVFALARSCGMAWHIDLEPVMAYRQHVSNDTGARSSFAGIARRLAAIRAGWYRRQVEAICLLVQAGCPEDAWSRRWLQLSARRGPMAAASRLAFVLRHGRRRISDRCVQAAAVVAGHL